MKSRFHGKSGKNKGFAKWENEKSNIPVNRDTTIHVMDQNGTETLLDRQKVKVCTITFLGV